MTARAETALEGSVGTLRNQVREFLVEACERGAYQPHCDAWLSGFSPDFSRELGRRGWIGMTWPERLGGHERSAVERLAVTEELLAAGAPVAAHWFADRQSGPQIFRHGSPELRERVLPAIARGECYFALGLSEPNSGSDLASVRTRATPSSTGWRLSGSKIWTSHAQRSHWISVLCRTSDAGDGRHEGLSVLAVDLASPGVDVRPIRLLTGEAHFNEVVFDDVAVPEAMLIGEEGQGWALVTEELALERSGAERFLSTFPLLVELTRRLPAGADRGVLSEVGALVAELATLRRLSWAIAATIDAGGNPASDAALVKDLGTRFEKRVIDVARSIHDVEPSLDSADRLDRLVAEGILSAPGYTIRGGTNEILRGIVARAAGTR